MYLPEFDDPNNPGKTPSTIIFRSVAQPNYLELNATTNFWRLDSFHILPMPDNITDLEDI